MKIAVLGTGIVGRTIASKLAGSNYTVVIGTRDVKATLSGTDKGEESAFVNWKKNHEDIDLKSFAEATADANVIFNCTSGMISLKALELAGKENIKNKLLIDLANPLDFSNGMPPSLNPVNTDSLGEQIQRNFPETKVVKALNTMTAGIMLDPSKVAGDHNVFICGNDADAKAETRKILNKFGWRDELIIDLGDISNARGTEMLLPIWLRLWQALGTAEFNFHIQK